MCVCVGGGGGMDSVTRPTEKSGYLGSILEYGGILNGTGISADFNTHAQNAIYPYTYICTRAQHGRRPYPMQCATLATARTTCVTLHEH